VLQW